MSIIQGNAKKSTVTGFYPKVINGSLRFNDDDSAYLSWTPASAGDTKKWTFSCWVKRARLGASQMLISAGTSSITYINFQADDTLKVRNSTIEYATTQKFRDPSAWYHIVFVWDTAQTTDVDRAKFYVNGELITSYSPYTKAALNETSIINTAVSNQIGNYAYNNTSYLDGYMAEVHFLNGIAATADDFGELKNGVWVAKAYEGAYDSAAQITAGTTNGFYLDFSATGTQFPITANGAVQHSTAQSKTGASSILFDGNGDYLETPANSEFALGTDDFTIEGWFYHNNSSLPTYEHLWGNYSPSGAGYAGNYALQFNYGSDVAYFYYGNGLSYALSLGSAFTAQTWHHVAIVRSSGTTTLYIDGVSKASTSDSADYKSQQPFCIGNYRDTAEANSFNGYIDEFRISKVARYNSGFTPSTTAFESDSDTLYLVQSDTTNGSTTFTDSSGVPSGLGNEVSGNENHWTTNNIDYTDQVLDSPTDNYCTWSPLWSDASTYWIHGLSDGNLVGTNDASNNMANIGSFVLDSGQWYWECEITSLGNVIRVGVTEVESVNGIDDPFLTAGTFYVNNGYKRVKGTNTASFGDTYTTGDVIGVALDCDANTVAFYKNGTLQGTISIQDAPHAATIMGNNSGTNKVTANFGQQPFKYDPPA